MVIHYEKYWLSRIISVQAIVSADYIRGCILPKSYHSHQDAWELVVCMKGCVLVNHGGIETQLQQQQLILIQPGIQHVLEITDPDARTFVLSFTCNNDDYLFSLQNTILQANNQILALTDGMVRELRSTFDAQAERLHLYRFTPSPNSPLGAEQMICCYLEQFLLLLLREATMKKGSIVTADQFHQAFQTYLTDRVTAYIQENLSGQLSVQSVADHFHYSRARLSALYKDATGISMTDAIANAQIQSAKRMLREKEMSISQISEALGFSSPQYFSYKFAKITGITPSQYCQKRKS